MDALKAEQLGSNKWRVLAIPFGGPLAGGKDLDGEYFSPRTDIKASWFKDRPVLFHHGQDAVAGDEEYGNEEMDPAASKDGWWGTVWLNRSARYWAQVDAMLRAGKMFGSSGAISHLVRKARDGEILVWPHAEQTLTPTPANPFARISASKALIADAVADDLWPDLSNGGEPSGDLPDGGDAVAMKRAAAITEAARLRARIEALRTI